MMTLTDLTATRTRYLEARALEDSATRGGATWQRYVAAMVDYGETLAEHGQGLNLWDLEQLHVALGRVQTALESPGRPPLVDLAVLLMRAIVDTADRLDRDSRGTALVGD